MLFQLLLNSPVAFQNVQGRAGNVQLTISGHCKEKEIGRGREEASIRIEAITPFPGAHGQPKFLLKHLLIAYYDQGARYLRGYWWIFLPKSAKRDGERACVCVCMWVYRTKRNSLILMQPITVIRNFSVRLHTALRNPRSLKMMAT